MFGRRHMRAGAGAVALVLVATGAAVTTVVSPPTALAAGAAVGVVADITWGTSRDDIDRTVSAMAEAGARWVRANVSWSGGEPDAKGRLNEGWLAEVDYAVNKARSSGMEVLMPVSDGVPYWASADPAKYQDASGYHWNKYWRPARASDYADFVQAMVNRYKALGVRTYEVWNEPNHTRFWPSGPNAAEYVSLLAAAYPAIKAADPTATVLLGGLSKNDYDYLDAVYRAGGRPYFDAVAVHPYTGVADPTWCWNQAGTTKLAVDAFCGIEEVRRTMEAHGDSPKGMWLTEFGWSTGTSTYSVTESTQASFLTAALTKLESYPYVQVAFWYNFRNNYWLKDDPADYEANLGLLRTDYSRKPAYGALQSWTGGALSSSSTTTTTSTTTTSTTTTSTTTTTQPVSADTQAPVISNVKVQGITANSATVTWTTNEPSSSRVVYGTSALTSSATGPGGVTSHKVTLSGLTRRTRYYYRVESIDAAGNVALSSQSSFLTGK